MDLFEIVIVLAIALIVLGPERLPEVLRTFGKILRELRAASNTVMRELSEVLEEEPARAESETPPPLEDPARATRPAAPPPVTQATAQPTAAAAPASAADTDTAKRGSTGQESS